MTAKKGTRKSNKQVIQPAVVLLGPIFFRNFDNVSKMLVEALSHLTLKAVPLFRVIPTQRNLSKDALVKWFERRKADVNSVFGSNYVILNEGSPVQRNNLAILGQDERSGATASNGKAKGIIVLGELAGHFTREAKDGQPERTFASGPESLLYHWTQRDDCPTVIQVLEPTATEPTPVVNVNPTEWRIWGKSRVTLEAPPKPGEVATAVNTQAENEALAEIGLA